MCEIKLKKCPRCDKEKPETREFFYWIGKLNRYENKCKICHINKINKPKDEIHFSENGIKFKKCTECGIEKEETSEFFQWGKDKCKYATQCRRCLNDKANKRSRDHRRKKNGYVAPEVKFSEME